MWRNKMERVDKSTGEIVQVHHAESDLITASDRAAIDTQISTAKMYPRNLTDFNRKAMELATQDKVTAEDCIYSLPRGGKAIVGPNVRLAEIVAACWGNIRVKARATHCDGKFAYAEALAWDLENNTAIQADGRQPVYGKKDYKTGVRLPPDQDAIANAMGSASSKALRNAIFKVVPQAVVRKIYLKVLEVIGGGDEPITDRREKMLRYWASQGVTAEQVCKTVGVKGIDDIGIEEIVVLQGVYTAIKDGIMRQEVAFPPPMSAAEKLEAGRMKFGKGAQKEKDAAKEPAAPAPAPEPPEPPAAVTPTDPAPYDVSDCTIEVGDFIKKGPRGKPAEVLSIDPPTWRTPTGREYTADTWPDNIIIVVKASALDNEEEENLPAAGEDVPPVEEAPFVPEPEASPVETPEAVPEPDAPPEESAPSSPPEPEPEAKVAPSPPSGGPGTEDVLDPWM